MKNKMINQTERINPTTGDITAQNSIFIWLFVSSVTTSGQLNAPFRVYCVVWPGLNVCLYCAAALVRIWLLWCGSVGWFVVCSIRRYSNASFELSHTMGLEWSTTFIVRHISFYACNAHCTYHSICVCCICLTIWVISLYLLNLIEYKRWASKHNIHWQANQRRLLKSDIDLFNIIQ